MDMHHFDQETEELAQRVAKYAVERLREDPPTLDHAVTEEELLPKLEGVITKEGLGAEKAFDVFQNIVAASTLSTDHPRYLAFVPNAPTIAASLIDLASSASSMYGGSWLEGAGVVAAENQALRFISDMIGLDENAGGVFVSGGTAANLSALIAARHRFRERNPEMQKTRLAIACAESAHSSVRQAAKAMDIDILDIPGDEYGRLTGKALDETLPTFSTTDHARLFAIVASAGTTNIGYVDDLRSTGEICKKYNLWFHVDGAYGGAAILCDKTKAVFDGVELCDSFVVDPHKWLFSPFDCAALIYKDPAVARRAHSQHAEYLEVLTERPEWNPTDYAHHLTRRPRGLTLWFTLAVYGTDAVARAVSSCMDVVYAGADLIRKSPYLELVVEPELSVIVFRRKGWKYENYKDWCDALLEKEFAFIVPTTYKNETVLRICIINPDTSVDDIQMIIDLLG